MRRKKAKVSEYTEQMTDAALRPVVKLRLAKEGIFFGPGAAQLMECIEETGSIQEACAKMELSYSKGSLGFKLLERWTGGTGGGGSRLTAEGRKLLKCYEELTEKVQESAEAIFAECFAKEAGSDIP